MQRLSRLLLRLAGWRLVGQAPARDKYMVLVYPHTSNWDFFLGILAAWGLGVPPAFLAKHTLFKGPMGFLFRAIGGIPVRRGSKENVVLQIAQLVEQRERVGLALAPEGTRSKTDRWKSGFYYIAMEAKLPVALGFIDASSRTVGLGPAVELTGDQDADMDVIREFYADKRGIRPENEGTITLR